MRAPPPTGRDAAEDLIPRLHRNGLNPFSPSTDDFDGESLSASSRVLKLRPTGATDGIAVCFRS
jgi:hypothetical protein